MANLGSDNTPVKGENFSLPAGAQIDEDDGDLVVRDSGGSIVLRRDEGAGTWDFVSEDVTGIASLEADTATIGGAKSDYHWELIGTVSEQGTDINVNVDFGSPISEGDAILLDVKKMYFRDESDVITLELNDVPSGSYDYTTANTTSWTTGSDYFEIYDGATFRHVVGPIMIQPGFQNRYSVRGLNNVTREANPIVIDRGTTTENVEGVDGATISTEGSASELRVELDVYRRVVS